MSKSEVERRLKSENRGFYASDYTFYLARKNLDCDSFFSPVLHWHDYFELEFVIKGSGTHTFDGITYDISKGYIFLVTPIDFHSVISNCNDPLEIYHIKFDESALSSSVMSELAAMEPPIMMNFGSKEYSYLLLEFKYLEKEFVAQRTYGALMLRAGFERICLMTMRRIKELHEYSKQMQSKLPHPHIQHAVNYLNFNFRRSISLQKVSEMLHLTPNYFGELFTQTMGISFTNYIKSLRLNYAHNLLLNSNLTISQICYESGFYTTSYFINNFKKQYGETPAEYRSNSKKSKEII